jgi:hypothetical protein
VGKWVLCDGRAAMSASPSRRRLWQSAPPLARHWERRRRPRRVEGPLSPPVRPPTSGESPPSLLSRSTVGPPRRPPPSGILRPRLVRTPLSRQRTTTRGDRRRSDGGGGGSGPYRRRRPLPPRLVSRGVDATATAPNHCRHLLRSSWAWKDTRGSLR